MQRMLFPRSISTVLGKHCCVLPREAMSRTRSLSGLVHGCQPQTKPTKSLLSFQQCSKFSTVQPWQDRPKLVILGAGWAAANLIRNLDERALKRYQILVMSPSNHFVNTPLLPSVSVGTLTPRSVVEPIRNFILSHRLACPDAYIKFNEVEAVEFDSKQKRIRVETRGQEGRESSRAVLQGMPSAYSHSSYWVDYDVLVCGVGATTNTFGTPGAMEYCTFLKTVQDAVKIRTTLLDCFETAAITHTPQEEVERLLTFVIIGAGPTGVEIAAEIRDFVKEDVLPHYSLFKEKHIRVQIVEMTDRMLGTYDKLIQSYAAKEFQKQDIEMFTKHQVKKVNPTSVEALDLQTQELKTLPFGMCVWASGVRPNTIALEIAKACHGERSRILEVDGNLRLLGKEGTIFALGDCAKIINPSLRKHAKQLFMEGDSNKDGKLQASEFKSLIEKARLKYPHLEAYLEQVSKESLAPIYASHQDVDLDAFEKACSEVDKQMKHLPPTAQVAQQQGEYLAKILNSVECKDLAHAEGFEPHFEYNHAGSMAYVGGEHAVIDSPVFGVASGLFTYIIWKGVYFGKGVSLAMKANMCFDWAKAWFLGRDTSRF